MRLPPVRDDISEAAARALAGPLVPPKRPDPDDNLGTPAQGDIAPEMVEAQVP